MDPTILMTTDAAARALGIKRSFLFQLLADGTLPSVKLGRKRLVIATDLYSFVERLRREQRATDD